MRISSLVPFAALTVIGILDGCATLRGDRTVCPEYRDMRCATIPECSMDAARSCRVCQCSPPVADSKGTLPSGVPPDRRTQ